MVITGIGAVTPIGNTFRESWQAAVAGHSGLAPIRRFDAADIPWKVAGELKGFDPYAFLGQKEVRRTDPFVHYAVAAALMAVQDAGWHLRDNSLHSPLAEGGIIIGSSRGGIGTIERAVSRSLTGKSRLSPYLMPSTTVSMAPSYIAQKLGIRGYCLGISNACASGTNAIGEAYRLIKSGYRRPVIAGGTDAPLCRLCIAGYGASGALSLSMDISASRPFDRDRNGFVLSEGACAMIVEEAGSALDRKADIYAEIVGYGNTVDAFHQTKPYSGGQIRAMQAAMKEAGLSPGDVDYISAHGTSTPAGDRSEAEAIEGILGKRTPEVAVSALKSMTGHMLAASGALETAFVAMSLKEGRIHPTINLVEKDPGCRLNIVTAAAAAAPKNALSNSFGFGGVNAVIALRDFHE